jgi:hypothetical protein
VRLGMRSYETTHEVSDFGLSLNRTFHVTMRNGGVGQELSGNRILLPERANSLVTYRKPHSSHTHVEAHVCPR